MANPYKQLSTKVQSQNKMIRLNRKTIEKAELQLQCACAHRDQNGAISIDTPHGPNAQKSRFTGAPLYRCRECFKQLDLAKIEQQRFDEGLNTINCVIDIGKMRLDCKNEKDRELLNSLASLQFQLNSLMPDLYKTIVKNQGGNKKKNRGEYADVMRVSN